MWCFIGDCKGIKRIVSLETYDQLKSISFLNAMMTVKQKDLIIAFRHHVTAKRTLLKSTKKKVSDFLITKIADIISQSGIVV